MDLVFFSCPLVALFVLTGLWLWTAILWLEVEIICRCLHFNLGNYMWMHGLMYTAFMT